MIHRDIGVQNALILQGHKAWQAVERLRKNQSSLESPFAIRGGVKGGPTKA